MDSIIEDLIFNDEYDDEDPTKSEIREAYLKIS